MPKTPNRRHLGALLFVVLLVFFIVMDPLATYLIRRRLAGRLADRGFTVLSVEPVRTGGPLEFLMPPWLFGDTFTFRYRAPDGAEHTHTRHAYLWSPLDDIPPACEPK